MKILTLKDTSLEKIRLDKPELSDNIMYIDIVNDDEPLYVQTPKMFTKLFEKSVHLIFDNSQKSENLKDFYSFIVDIEKKICELISENSEKWFPEKVTYESIYNNFFNSSLKRPESLENSLFLSADKLEFEIYDRKNNKTTIEALDDKTDTTTVLLANELVITKTNACIVWEVAQMKLHKKHKIKKSKKYSIREEDKKENINEDKKIKISLIGDVDSLDGDI